MRSWPYHSSVDLRQLRCFVAVAEELHFGRAAARLHVAGPAVSQTIRGLENELGLKLFNRSNRRVEMTHAGTVLLAEARAVLNRFDSAMIAIERVRGGEHGRVRVAAVPALPPQLIPRFLAHCAAEAPGLEVVVAALQSGSSATDALDSGADLALVRGEVAETGVVAVVVVREPVGVALPNDHPLADEATVRVEQLRGVPLIGFSRATDPEESDRIFAALRAAGLDAKLVHESHAGAVESSLRLVAQGTGASLKLESEVEAFGSPRVVWRPLQGVALEVVISAAWRPTHATPALERVLPLVPHATTASAQSPP